MTGETKTEKAGTEDAPNKDEVQGNATVRLPHYVRNSVIGVVCAVAFAAAIEVAFVVLLNSPFYSHVDDDASADSGVQQETVVHVDEEGLPKLTDWEYFDTYWRECSLEDATYIEETADGIKRCYSLCDGWMPGEEVSELPILRDSKQVMKDDGWSLVVVNCATGELSWWIPQGTLLKRLNNAADFKILRGSGFRADNNKWFFYANTLTMDRTGYGEAIYRETLEEAAEDKASENYPQMTDTEKENLITAAMKDQDYVLINALIVHYGEKEIMEYLR